ncbi:hypothetical protein VC279_00315 [Xanthomonas sp. WHRI 10064A]|uniref:hypothetical protein n=1 Tax=unclassified Xanthomonas TaxID=2643310 RepID=UPI002B23B4B0|nr:MULTISPECIES: hypothetical protein [unclassified Xanthomonas]MEA9588249.1 hypothetical protein [Xanthomonas sp. WHRI 10064B]MEA9613235.1 hypothetical protein [Xanthomonas sp. WHRI 10064A]
MAAKPCGRGGTDDQESCKRRIRTLCPDDPADVRLLKARMEARKDRLPSSGTLPEEVRRCPSSVTTARIDLMHALTGG